MPQRFQFSLRRLLAVTAMFALSFACARWFVMFRMAQSDSAAVVLAAALASFGARIAMLLSQSLKTPLWFMVVAAVLVRSIESCRRQLGNLLPSQGAAESWKPSGTQE